VTDAELTAEVARLRDYLLERGYWVIDSPPHCRVKPAGMAHLFGDISLEAARKRLSRYGIEPVKVGGQNTFRLSDYVLAITFQRAA
jgi:hypothetical protein